MKNIILEPKNPGMETMYLFHSFIALHIKFHPEGENERKMVSFTNDNLQHPPPRLSHLLFTRAHITYGHAWKGADAFLSFLYKHMLPWSPSSNLVWALLPWLLSHTSLLNILLSQLSPKYSFLLNLPSEDTELHTPILGHEKALSSKDGSELLVTQEFSGFREKISISVNGDWCFILWTPVKRRGLYLAMDALAHSRDADEHGIGRTFEKFSRLKRRNNMQYMVIVRKRLLSGMCEISVFFRHLNLDLLTSGYFQYFPYLDSQAFQTVMFHFMIFVCLFFFLSLR